MRRTFLLAAAAAGLTLAAMPAAAAPARRAAPIQRDWSRTIVTTPEGGYRMGNPAARVKLVEYGSLTCGHCAHFAQTGMAALVANHVRTGKVSYEFRNYILNGIDVTASLVARCAHPSNFFKFVDRLYATQGIWVPRISTLPQAEKDRLKALPEGQRLGALADVGGLTAMGAQFGVPAARAKACLADQAALDRLGGMAEAAGALGVTGTPTFFINGNMAPVNEWPALEPLLRQAGG
ncbi:MAG TPA: thioredoxin domain-containing protein [Allosphingosinicella sp.]|nr:thioredoxin domain-containing protein [Allosphingosinicella sp.]